MTNTRRTKKNISKELMFSKIMPTYSTNTLNEYYQSVSETRTPRSSDPDTFKIREKVLSAIEDRVPIQDRDDDIPLRNDFDDARFRQSFQNRYQQAHDQVQPQQPYQSTRVFPVQNTVYDQPLQNDQSYHQAPVQVQTPAAQVQSSPQIDNDKPRYINITEEVLYSTLTAMIARFKCCNCEKCRQQIMLNVLNNVKPEYVYKKPSEVKELIENNNYVDINQPLVKAIIDTKANPPHKQK